MKLRAVKILQSLRKVRLFLRLNKLLIIPPDANEILSIKQASTQLILDHLIHGAQDTFSSEPAILKDIYFETKISGPVSFNIQDKVHLLFLKSHVNDFLCDILRKFSSPNTAFLDIGSNIGFYSWFYQAMGENHTVFVFEPNPSLIPHLEINLKKNNTHIFGIALSDETSTVQLFFDENSTGRGSLERDYFTNSVKVNTDRLDNVINIQQEKFSKYIIKVDVEEHEPKVLRGMLNWLGDTRPKLIYLEARPQTIDEICEILFHHNFFLLTQNLEILFGRELDNFLARVKDQKYTNIVFSNSIQDFLHY
jgi:FkbM family methyltransferase